MAAIGAIAGPPRAHHRRGLLPGPPGDGGRRAGRHAGRRRRLQLLPDQEPRRARRRRRRGHQRSRRWPSGSGSSATAGRPTATCTRSPGVNSRLDELQAAVLRARLPRLAALDRRRGGRSRRSIVRTCRRRPPVARARPRPRLSPVSYTIGEARRAAGRSGRGGRGNLDPLSDSAQPAAGVRAPRGARPVRGRRRRRGLAAVAAAAHPRLRAGDVRRVAAAVQAFEEGQTTA